MKWWKKITAIMLGAVLALSLCQNGGVLVKAAQTYYVSEDSGSDTNVGTSKGKAFKTLKKAVSAAAEGDNIRVLDTISITDTLNISKGVTIGRTTDLTGYMIVVQNDAELTLRGTVTVTGRKSTVRADKSLIKVKEGGTLHIKGQAVIKGNVSKNIPGGAVINQGTMNISGGCVIEGNATSVHGGGAIYNEANLNMSGGTIRNNLAGEQNVQSQKERCGGGVLNSGVFRMTGGIITGNSAEGNGGGVHNVDGATFVLEAGAITKNTTDAKGGGVCCSDSIFQMLGGEISGNTAMGGGAILLGQDQTPHQTLNSTISGGKILDNHAVLDDKDSNTGRGGGIIVREHNVLTITGGLIKANSGENGGGGICIGNDGTVIIKNEDVILEDNDARIGGAIQIRSGGSLEMRGGTLKDNRAVKGNGIYHDGEFSLSGTIDFGSGDDVYLAETKYISLIAAIRNRENIVRLTPSSYELGRVCVKTTQTSMKASSYIDDFILTENAPYLLRPGDFLPTEANVNDTELIISRTYILTYEKNISRQVSNFPQNQMMYWMETCSISKLIPKWSEKDLFENWNKSADGSGAIYVPGEVLKLPTSNVRLYAQWLNLPPTITAEDCYIVEDELDTRLTKSFLKSYARARDPEEGDVSERILILNWDEIMTDLKKEYTELEKKELQRTVEVVYQIEDSCGEIARTKAKLIVFILEDISVEDTGYVRFLAKDYVEDIATDTTWGTEKKKAYLMEIFEKDTSEIEWEN